ncbi:MAG TPA: hypothetical protein VMZ52_16440 [Bryobacteraceae bacterium]|nr:hypothetical protein [Bryobacteraceae bacterium]
MRKRLTMAIALVFTGAALLAKPADVQFKAAQHKEQVEGDLKGAIELYKKIAQGGDRALAAKALVAIGQCHEKLGAAEARAAYERVVREFADQPESVRLAHTRLAAILAPAPQSGQTARQVWIARSSEGFYKSVPSPDGRYFGFTDWETGDLCIRDLTAGTNRRLTNTGGWEVSGDYADGSVISPDGRQMAYFWFAEKDRHNELRIISTSGGTPKTLLQKDSNGSYMSPVGWTPDGKQLLVTLRQPDNTTQLAMLGVQDGSIRTLKTFTWQSLDARLAPNGQHITYDLPASEKSIARDIFVLAVDGSRETRVVESPADDSAPLWSPDGSHILFLSDRTGTQSLWSIPVENGKAKGPAELIKADAGRIQPMGIARNGTLHYVMEGSSRSNVYMADLGRDLKISKAPVLATERFVNANMGASLSPDGESLAYFSLRPGTTVLVVRNLKTGEEKDVPLRFQLVPSFHIGPKWFPDGRSMLVVLREPQRPGVGFYRIDLTSGSTEILHHAVPQGFQGWSLSPDGKSIFYTQRKNNASDKGFATRLLRFDIDSQRESELKSDAWVIAPTVSPDGKQVAFVVSVRPGSASYIAVMPSSGGEAREVFRGSPWMDGSRYNTLAWSPDQRHLLFIRGGVGENTPNVLWRVPVGGGQPEQMGLSMPGRVKFPQIHPDGHRMFFGAIENGPTEVWALENFLPKTIASK